jgi:acetyl-CoA acetyltransferase
MTEVHVVGAGIHPFGRHPEKTGSSAAGAADAALPRLGLTGVQFINISNGCATGGSSLLSGYWAIKSGEFDIGVVMGFDKHPRGAFNADPEASGLQRWYGETGMMLTTQFFAMKIRRYMDLYGISNESLGRVAEKAFENASHTPHAWRREPVGLNTILGSQMLSDPLTKYMFCSPAEGGAALILASDKKMRELGLSGPRVRGAAVRTRVNGSFEVFSPSLDVERGPSPTQIASAAAYEMAGVGPSDIHVAQIQDTESGAEIMHMAENGFCADGEQEQWLAEGRTRLTGSLPTNTDGGCLACGEPVGASGLRQVYENVQQLRKRADGRQVENARLAYSQVYGAPGLSAVAILEA